MSSEAGDERLWAADKREFVADWRDWVADERDRVADERERAADQRAAEMDEWERRIEARATELGLPQDETAAAARRERSSARLEAATARALAQAQREGSTSMRGHATARRRTGPTLLAMAFAGIAEQLYNAESVDDVLRKITEAAVSTVAGCGMASITLSGPDGYTTAASTHEGALSADQAQYESDEGPCVEALGSPLVYARAFPDERWPRLGPRPTEFGVHSAVSYHLSASSPESADPADGSLNAYGLTESAFDDEAREVGFVLAAHASVAIHAVAQREGHEDSVHDLHEALMSRDVIGQAKGILMERLKITPDDAFDVLRRASQSLNLKLREVAAHLAETGDLHVEQD